MMFPKHLFSAVLQGHILQNRFSFEGLTCKIQQYIRENFEVISCWKQAAAVNLKKCCLLGETVWDVAHNLDRQI